MLLATVWKVDRQAAPQKKSCVILSGPAGAVVPVVTVIVTDVPINGFHAIALRKQELHL